MSRYAFMALVFLLWSAASLGAVSAVDSLSRAVTLAAPAQRIVSLAPHITELVFAAGAGAKLVGVSEYSDFPQAARKLPRVGSSFGINVEEIIALHPDLVVAWRFGANTASLDQLTRFGIPVFYSEPEHLAEIPAAVETLGRLAGTDATALAEARRLRNDLEHIREAYAGRAPIRVFYEISERPLMTLNARHFVSDALSLCGGKNIFADAPLIAPSVDAEAVLARDPQVIIAARSSTLDPAWSARWKRFGALSAVRDGNLVTLEAEPMHRNGPRAIAATRALCELLDGARKRSGLMAASPR